MNFSPQFFTQNVVPGAVTDTVLVMTPSNGRKRIRGIG